MNPVNRSTWSTLSALLLVGVGCTHAPPARQIPSGAPTLRVMTYNVNYGSDPAIAARIIQRANVDIVCLQETTADFEPLLRESLGARFAHMIFHQEPAAGGIAILSRYPIEQTVYDRAPGGWFHGLAARAEATPIGPVQLLNVHLHPPLNDHGSATPAALVSTASTRRDETDYLIKQLDPSLPTLVAGDFNEGPSGRAVAYLSDHQFTDALHEFAPAASTWRWPTSVITLRGKYDHIFYSPKLIAYDATVVDAGQSDHLPVVAVLAPAAAP